MGRAADRIGPWGTLVAKWERSTHVSGGGGTECTQWDWGSERERTRGVVGRADARIREGKRRTIFYIKFVLFSSRDCQSFRSSSA
jgi:hypothetical protein